LSSPHESWAQYYDTVYERSFGAFYGEFTSRVLEKIGGWLTPPSRIVDFGAGTGRLSIPLARAGFRVTAVDPSAAMLACLEKKAGTVPVDTFHGPTSAFLGPPIHDLGLCVFSVITYILDEAELRASLEAAARALVSGGLLLLDVPTDALFQSLRIKTEGMRRRVDITPRTDVRFGYHEQTVLHVNGVEATYEDQFEIRRWTYDEVVDALRGAGFRLKSDLSDEFYDTGAMYLLAERP
jgi:SAM-dependent methyltransferase